MSEELTLVSQLAIILISASVFTIISKALKQPVILGYIVAGFFVGPHLGLFPQFSPESVSQWSELGIIFLLFGLGLEFSFKKLLNVGSSAFIAAITICAGMFVMGYVTGTALRWDTMERLFLGGMLSMSSTTIIIKAYDDLGVKHAPHASLVFGLLVVEDLLAVLMMVLFSTIAVSKNFSGLSMLGSLGKLVAFLVLCFVVGIYLLPTILKKTRKWVNDEIMLLIGVGLCFLMVILANVSGFSSALGAFLMGSILSSTIEGARIEKLTADLKNLFGSVFFVSVGMMVDPSVIATYWPVIIVVTLVAMTGILVFSTMGVLLSGKSLDTALHVGFSLPQLGEFSFIIAGLGCSLGALRDFIYPVIISVSVITTFTTPYMIKAADPVSAWLHKKLPQRTIDFFGRKEQPDGVRSRAEANHWKDFFSKYLLRICIYGLILTVMLVGINGYLPGLADRFLPDLSMGWRRFAEILVSLAVMSPFLYGLAVNGSELKRISETLIANNSKARITIYVSVYIRIFLAVAFAFAVIFMFTDLTRGDYLLILIALVVTFVLARRAVHRFTGLEDTFFRNLNAMEDKQRQEAPVSTMVRSKFSGYDVHIVNAVVSSDFEYAGMKMSEMPFRFSSGVNILEIQRGSRKIIIPSGNESVFPGDILVAVGTNEQTAAFKRTMEENTVVTKNDDSIAESFSVEPVCLEDNSELTGKVLKDTDMRADGCMVISVERGDAIITNPSRDFQFQSGDVVWMAGLGSSIEWYKTVK